jgi:hypothetical protein
MWRLVLIGVLLLAGCAGDEGGDPAAVVERYLQAKVEADRDALMPLLCSAMEADLAREAASFAAVDARLEDSACSRVGDTDRVQCEGNIIITYGAEDSEFPLGVYQVVQEDGEWRWCGEAE